VTGLSYDSIINSELSETTTIQQSEKSSFFGNFIWKTNTEIEEDAEDLNSDAGFSPFFLTPLFNYQFHSGNTPFFKIVLNNWKQFPSSIELFLLFENLRN
jgi:hypothetical protein